ncbi:MAG: molybdopterin synthase [Haloarculaceae archaeon]
MQVLAVTGQSDSGKTTLVERLVDRLSDRGSVATVKHLRTEPTVDTEGKDTARHRRTGADVTYGLTEDEGWFATGSERTLDATLDDLAADYDYALLEGYSSVALPTVALGGRDHAGETVATAPDADAVDVDALVEDVEALEPYESLGSLVAAVERSPDARYAGAIATFTGRVRRQEHDEDPPTEHLEFEKYEGVAEQRMADIRAELEERDGVHEVRMHHRTGVVESGEDVVFVVVLAGHRREAFRTVEDGIDRLKDEVPLFKKEVTVEDEFWRHERPE